MRTSVYLLAALGAVAFSTALAQNTGNPAATPGTQTPVRQPRPSPTPSQPTQSSQATPPSQTTQPSQAAPPSQNTQPSQPMPPSQATQPSQSTLPSQPTQQAQPSAPTQQTQPNATTRQTQPAANTQQTVRPPDSARANDANDRAKEDANNAANNAAQQNQSRVPPAMRGVGTTGSRPDCTRLRGIEKAECERRDTSRDDLPAGVTTTQPEKPQE